MFTWSIGPSARGARKMFGRPIREDGTVDTTGVAEDVLLGLEHQGVLRRVYAADQELTKKVQNLEQRVADLEAIITSLLEKDKAA